MKYRNTLRALLLLLPSLLFAQTTDQLHTVQQVEQPNLYGRAMAMQNGIGYFTNGAGFYSVDFSEPLEPTLLYHTQFFGSRGAISVDGDLLAVGSQYEGIAIFDISDPTIPQRLTIIEDTTDIDCLLRDTLLIVHDDPTQELHFYSLAIPSQPRRLSTVPYQYTHYTLKLSLHLYGDSLLVSSGGRCRLLDLSNTSDVEEIWRLDSLSTGGGTFVSTQLRGDILIAWGMEGLVLFDLSSLENISRINASTLPAAEIFPRGMEITGNTAFLLDINKGVNTADFSNPALPTLVDTIDLQFLTPFAIHLSGDLLYVQSLDHYPHVFDISNAGNAVLFSRFKPLDERVETSVIMGERLYQFRMPVRDWNEPYDPGMLKVYDLDGLYEPILAAATETDYNQVQDFFPVEGGFYTLKYMSLDLNEYMYYLKPVQESGNSLVVADDSLVVGGVVRATQQIDDTLYVLDDDLWYLHETPRTPRLSKVILTSLEHPELADSYTLPDPVQAPFLILDTLLVAHSGPLSGSDAGDTVHSLQLYSLSSLSVEADPLFSLTLPGNLLELKPNGDGLLALVNMNPETNESELHHYRVVEDTLALELVVLDHISNARGLEKSGEYIALSTYQSLTGSEIEVYALGGGLAASPIASMSSSYSPWQFSLSESGFLNVNETYRWGLYAIDDPRFTYDTPEAPAGLPRIFEISDLYPNPFNHTLRMTINLLRPANLTVDVFNVMGQRVSGLASGPYRAGQNHMIWNPEGMSSGLYIVKASSGREVQSKKVVYLK